MGDFNSVPWSTTHKAFRAATGLHNEGPMVETWPAWGPFWMRLPIDHIFVRGQLERREQFCERAGLARTARSRRGRARLP